MSLTLRTCAGLLFMGLLLPAPIALATEPTETSNASKSSSTAEAREQALAKEYERLFQENDLKTAAHTKLESPSFGQTILRTTLALAVICGLIYLLLGKLWPRFMHGGMAKPNQRLMTVIDRLVLEPRRSILVVRVTDQYFLIGSNEKEISLISKLDENAVETALADQKTSAPPTGLTSLLFKRSSKES